MNTFLAYLKSKTVQGIIGLVILGIMKTYKVDILPEELMGTLFIMFTGWAGIGARDAMKPIKPVKP